MASALAAKMGFNSLLKKQARNFSVRISTMESDMEFSCEVCIQTSVICATLRAELIAKKKEKKLVSFAAKGDSDVTPILTPAVI